MQIDPNNSVIRLCAQGIQAEMQHQFELAASLYQRAWDEHQNDYEAAIAAHYLARNQPTLEDSLRWNQ